jgi:hypothetical protein
MSIELWFSALETAKEMREMSDDQLLTHPGHYVPRGELDGKYLREAVDKAALEVPIPALDLTRELYSAVVRSVDDDCSASEALEKLQQRVLLACARFECSTVIV